MKKKNVRRLLFVLGVVAALLGAGVVVILTIGRTASPLALPNPNGYDDLLQAGQAVTGTLDDAPNLDRDRLHALVATNAEALRLLRVGLRHRCAVPTETQITNFANISGDLIALKSLARVLSAEGRLAEMENRPADAARSYVDAIHLGSAMSAGGLIINRLVGIACEGVGSIRLVKLLPKLNCEQVRPLIADLQKIDDTTVPWREVVQNENRFARAELGRYPNPIKLVSEVWQARDTRRASAEHHDLAAARLRLLIVELALRAYRCDEGKEPGSLTQLVTKYLQHLPMDPFSGNPLVYRAAGTNWVLYSLGPDRVDDGGKPSGKIISGDYPIGVGAGKASKGQNKGDLFYDSER
jgi:hypothetical protein